MEKRCIILFSSFVSVLTWNVLWESPVTMATAVKSSGTQNSLQGCPTYCLCNKTIAVTSTGKSASLSIRCTRDPASDINFSAMELELRVPIEQITLTDSRLSRFPVSLCNLKHLQNLNVTNNSLTELPPSCINNLTALVNLIASGNKVTAIRNGTFYDLQFLNIISLDNNSISVIEADVFFNTSRLPSLTNIWLRYNKLKALGNWPIHFFHREMNFELRDNNIEEFTNPWQWSYKCESLPNTEILLKDNKIHHLMDVFLGWGFTSDIIALYLIAKNNLHLDVRNNPIICDCVDYRIYKYFPLAKKSEIVNQLSCSAPPSLKDKMIVRLSLDDFICHRHDHCPQGCNCVETPNRRTISVNCQHVNISEMPNILPHRNATNQYHNESSYQYVLQFQGTKLTILSHQAYYNVTKTADFGNSLISNITDSALSGLKDIETLSLAGNKLTHFPKVVINISFDKLQPLGLSLEGNPWTCDCQTLWFKHWLLNMSTAIANKDSILCYNPERFRGQSILKLADDKFICGDPPNTELLVVIVAAVGTFVASITLFGAPCLAIYIARVWVYTTFHWHPFDWDECEGENKIYDAFVCYTHLDQEFIFDTILPILEGRGYKVCIHCRDFEGGMPITQNIERAILGSKRIVMYLTENSLESSYWMWEFTQAFNLDLQEKKNRLIIIKSPNLDPSDLDETLKAYLKKFTYIEERSKYFQRNLLYSMPVHPVQTEGEENNENRENQLPAAANQNERVVRVEDARPQEPVDAQLLVPQDPANGNGHQMAPLHPADDGNGNEDINDAVIAVREDQPLL